MSEGGYGARLERDEQERRAMRDSRDQRYGERRPRGEDHDDEHFESQGGRQSFNRDNEYRFNENRGRREMRSNDDYYGRDYYGRGGQSDWRSYPQQGSFERAGYDSDREFWEGERAGRYGQSGRYGGQGWEHKGAGGRSGSFGGGGYGSPGGYGSSGSHASFGGYGQQGQGGQYGQQRHFGGQGAEYGRHGGYGEPSFGGSSGNYGQHGGAGGHRSGQHDFGASSGNYWEHGGGGYAGQRDYRGSSGGHWQGGGGGYHPEQFGQESFGGDYGQQGWGRQGSMRNRPPKGYTRSDERLKEDICERLMSMPHVDAGEVSVEVKDAKVVLEGTVPERSMKHRIEDCAEGVSGVKDVENRIRVSRDGSWQGGAESSHFDSVGSSHGSGPQASSGSTSHHGAGTHGTGASAAASGGTGAGETHHAGKSK